MEVTVYCVSSFTANGKGGNPAGVVLDAQNLSEQQMLYVAAEMGFSETAFLSASEDADYRVRFFTTTGEVDLCGHASIASWFLLKHLGKIVDGVYLQETNAGLLSVQIINDLTYMQQTQPDFAEMVSVPDVAHVLNIHESDFSETLRPQIVSTGLRDLIVVLNNEEVLNAIQPNFEAMARLSDTHKIIGLHVVAMLYDSNSLVAARNFAPLVGIDEESATGTSNGALLCYLRNNNVLPERQEYRIEQGKAMNCTSYIFGKFHEGIVWVGGKATLVEQKQVQL